MKGLGDALVIRGTGRSLTWRMGRRERARGPAPESRSAQPPLAAKGARAHARGGSIRRGATSGALVGERAVPGRRSGSAAGDGAGDAARRSREAREAVPCWAPPERQVRDPRARGTRAALPRPPSPGVLGLAPGAPWTGLSETRAGGRDREGEDGSGGGLPGLSLAESSQRRLGRASPPCWASVSLLSGPSRGGQP